MVDLNFIVNNCQLQSRHNSLFQVSLCFVIDGTENRHPVKENHQKSLQLFHKKVEFVCLDALAFRNVGGSRSSRPGGLGSAHK